MMKKIQQDQHRPAPWLYLFGALTWTWSFLGAAALLGGGLYTFPNVVLAALGGLGPLIVPGILIARGRWDPKLDKYAFAFYQCAFNLRRLTWRWALIILGMVLVLAVGPVLLDRAVLREQGLFNPGSIFTLLIGLIFGALEEPGWRGYAQEGMQRRMPVLWASLVVGVFWAMWHLPLFLIPGTYQAGLGLGSLAFWCFNLALIIGSPVYAWVYNAPGKVIFAAMLYHGMGNLVRELVPDVSNLAEVGVEAALSMAVILIAWRWMSNISQKKEV
jgi:uncharacterized protein